MKNKYFIEVHERGYNGEDTYVNKKSWESKTPQFFTNKDKAIETAKEFYDYILDEYASYIRFHVFELHEIIEESNKSITQLSNELNDRINQLTELKSRLDKSISSGEFSEAHDILNDYEFIYYKIDTINEELNTLNNKLEKYNSWK